MSRWSSSTEPALLASASLSCHRWKPRLHEKSGQRQTGELTGKRLKADDVLQMVKRRAAEAGFDPAQVTHHTFRTTGITIYLENDGDLEVAQHITGHAWANTTRICDHCDERVEQEEIERVRI